MSRAPHLTRRVALQQLGLGSAAVGAGCVGRSTSGASQPSTPPMAAPISTPPAFAGAHQPIALPFTPGALHGLSERLMVSHHEHNYGGAVKNLNRTEKELAALAADAPGFIVAALRERELTFRNSKTLHESYFGNLGGDGRRSGPIEGALAQAYGSTARWEQHMRATALGLGGGSGWAVVALELDTGALRTFASGHHTQSLANSAPLLVLDMYEHAYQMDFGAAAARYIDAFFANVDWDAVNERLERAARASQAIRGAAS